MTSPFPPWLSDHDEQAQRGWETVERLHRHDGGIEALDRLAEVSPDLASLVVRFAYGELYTRPGLSPRDRHIATLASLTALGGCENQLEVHLGSSLDDGIAPQEVAEVLLHLISYVGFPRVLNAMGSLREVLARRRLVPGPTDSGR